MLPFEGGDSPAFPVLEESLGLCSVDGSIEPVYALHVYRRVAYPNSIHHKAEVWGRSPQAGG
jgi:hypothetical protein